MSTTFTGSDAQSVKNFYQQQCQSDCLLLVMNIPAHNRGEITPPPSLHSPLLTPPPSDERQTLETREIHRQIAEHRFRQTGETILKVNKKVWATLSPLLLEDNKLRLDYFPSTECLVLRMPNEVHEQFTACLSAQITTQLYLLSSGSGSAADFAKDIRPRASGSIRPLDSEYGRHDPDISFKHRRSPLPTVIIEVAHSQEKKELRALAEEYILGSNLRIRVVVGVDIEYNGNGATFSVWRAKLEGSTGDEAWVVKPTITDLTFRNANGTPNLIDQGAGLRLSLEDFADPETSRQFKDIDRDIFVSCNELYRYLEEAEIDMKITQSVRPEGDQPKKRRRSKTPEEQLNDHDEKSYAEAEERVSKRQELDDSSYNPSESS